MVYLRDKNTIVVVYSQRVAPQVRMIYGEDALFMSASQLAGMYPEQFTITPRKKVIRGDFSEQLYIYLTKEQKAFVSGKENASAFIRSLIDEAISKERSTDGEWFLPSVPNFINQALDNTVKSFNYEKFILLHKEERLSYH